MYWRKEELSDLKKVQSLEIFSSKIILSKEKRSLKSDFFFFQIIYYDRISIDMHFVL